MKQGFKVGGDFHFIHYDKDGTVIDQWDAGNLVTTAGLDALLNDYFIGSAQSTFHVALLGTTPTITAGNAIGDLTEVTAYTGNRQAYVAARTNEYVSNSASTVTYTFTTAATVGGAALVAASTGAALMFCGAANSGGDKTLADTETLEVTYVVTAADDGV